MLSKLTVQEAAKFSAYAVKTKLEQDSVAEYSIYAKAPEEGFIYSRFDVSTELPEYEAGDELAEMRFAALGVGRWYNAEDVEPELNVTDILVRHMERQSA